MANFPDTPRVDDVPVSWTTEGALISASATDDQVRRFAAANGMSVMATAEGLKAVPLKPIE